MVIHYLYVLLFEFPLHKKPPKDDKNNQQHQIHPLLAIHCYLNHAIWLLFSQNFLNFKIFFLHEWQGMFVLILMQFSWWFQIWSWNSKILTFFYQICFNVWPVVCTRLPRGKHKIRNVIANGAIFSPHVFTIKYTSL